MLWTPETQFTKRKHPLLIFILNQYMSLATKILQLLPPETAHNLAIRLLRTLPVKNMLTGLDLSLLGQNLLGQHFTHPLGFAAGFDKNAEVFDKLGQMGFAFVEVGSITPRPQAGNPKPRLFRLPGQQAIINRLGFNSKGMDYAARGLQLYPYNSVIGINLGKNKDTVNDVDDFLRGAETLATYANYFTINVSSPNTPGLRALQQPESLEPIITGIRAITQAQQRPIPLLVKLSPDMTLTEESAVVEFLLSAAIDGIIISNTSINRDGIMPQPHAKEIGGLSGLPLKTRATEMLRRVYRLTQGQIVLIGCGGISSGQDAYERMCAGADLLQLYSAFIYQGPHVLSRILFDLQRLLLRNGIKNIREIIGSETSP